MMDLFLDNYKKWLDGRSLIPGLGHVNKIWKAKVIGWELRRFLGNYHLVRGRKNVYGILMDVDIWLDSRWREIVVEVTTVQGMKRAVAFMPLFYAPLNMINAVNKLMMNGLFFGTKAEFGEYIKMIITAPPLDTETWHSDDQYII